MIVAAGTKHKLRDLELLDLARDILDVSVGIGIALHILLAGRGAGEAKRGAYARNDCRRFR